MAKKREACSLVHLAPDPLRLGVDAVGGAVAVRKRKGGDHGVAVPLQALRAVPQLLVTGEMILLCLV